ncbi:hypothetical protein LXL04_009398 [Taraxacum kok-saghyz]
MDQLGVWGEGVTAGNKATDRIQRLFLPRTTALFSAARCCRLNLTAGKKRLGGGVTAGNKATRRICRRQTLATPRGVNETDQLARYSRPTRKILELDSTLVEPSSSSSYSSTLASRA